MIPLPSLDTLLTLPSVFIFLLPSFLSSYSISTYLNVLLFTLTWSTLVLSYGPLTVEFYSTLFVRIVFFLVPSAFFLAFDVLVPSVAESIKARGRRALPSPAFNISSSSLDAKLQLLKLVGLAAANTFLASAVQTFVDFVFTELTPFKSAVRINALPPTPWSIAKDLTRSYIIRGVLAYYIHRYLLHARASRSRTISARALTNLHEGWAHSLLTPIPFSAAYDHPLCYLLNRWLPVYASTLFFRLHLLTYLLFTALVSLEEAFSYSGYTLLPSSILLAGVARRQEDHYETGGKGNFGPWGVMDWVHSTTLGGRDVIDDVRQEATKRDVRGKTQGVVGDVQGALRRGQDALTKSGRDAGQQQPDRRSNRTRSRS